MSANVKCSEVTETRLCVFQGVLCVSSQGRAGPGCGALLLYLPSNIALVPASPAQGSRPHPLPSRPAREHTRRWSSETRYRRSRDNLWVHFIPHGVTTMFLPIQMKRFYFQQWAGQSRNRSYNCARLKELTLSAAG